MITKKVHIIRLVFSIASFWFSSINIYTQTPAQVSIPFEIYDNAGGQKTLYFGLDQTAGDGIDVHLGESDLPPYPPTGAFDARWILPQNGFNGSLSSWRDYRFAEGFPYSGTIEYRFRYQSMDGATAMFFNWNLPSEVTGLIQDLVTGNIVNVPISGSGTYQLNNFVTLNQLKLIVYYNNTLSGVEDENQLLTKFILKQNYPNPFNPGTIISYLLPVNSNVTLKVFDMLGNEVTTLVNDYKPAGNYKIEFNPLSGNRHLASGIYLYQLKAGNFNETKQMILIK